MTKKIWRKNFEIFRMPIFTTGLPVLGAISDGFKITKKKILKDFLLVSEGYDLLAAYIPARQLRETVESILKVIKNNPDIIITIHKEGIVENNKFFKFIKQSFKINLSNLTDKKLAQLLNDYYRHHRLSNGRLTMTTWFVDSDGEDLTKFLITIVKDKIKLLELKINSVEAFTILTTPDKLSMASKEEIESLKILKLINSNSKSKKLFFQKNIQYIENNLDTIEPIIKRKIISHYKKWLWMPYTYIGPAYKLNYYISMWSGLMVQKIDINKNLKSLENQTAINKKARQELIKEIKLNLIEKKYFHIARSIIHLKSYRKDVWFFSSYLLEFIHKEIGRRLNLSLKQIRMMTFDEIPIALIKGYFSEKILNERFKKSAYIFDNLKSKVYAGKEADKFLKTQNIEKEKIVELKNLLGTPAKAGYAKGQVKIINVPEEIQKMKKGDIMVSATTYPSLVPAMKLAAAIVTNDGGITCHAAIVARELKIPCVVGTKIATKILKDGDMVEVDANKGIIKKLS